MAEDIVGKRGVEAITFERQLFGDIMVSKSHLRLQAALTRQFVSRGYGMWVDFQSGDAAPCGFGKVNRIKT
jgi:hypothetical protein